jgi:hypothetical protein
MSKTRKRKSDTTDVLSSTLRERLCKEWKDEIKFQSPRKRRDWLTNPEQGVIAFEAKRRTDLVKELDRRRMRVRSMVCGDAWLEAFDTTGELMPGFHWTTKSTIESDCAGRVRLQLSRNFIAYGDGGDETLVGPAFRRWTPPNSVELEDMIDGLNSKQAAWACLSWPESPSAVIIHRISAMKAKPSSGQW